MSEQLKPELRFPEFDECWKLLRLGNITSKIGSGKTPRGGESNYQLYGVPFIRSQNVQNGSLELDDTHIPLEIHEEMSNSKTKPFDILLNITGASIGRCCIVPEDLKEANVNQHVAIIRIESGEPLFYQNFIISHSGQKLIYQQQTTGGKEGLNFKSIRNFKVPSPSVEEQQKIANFLKAIDKRIKLLKTKKDALEDYKTSLMQKLFSQEIRFKQDDGSDFPEWEEKKLSALFNGKKGKGLPKSSIIEEGKYPCVLYGELYTKYDEVIERVISYTHSEDGVQSHKGDLLMPTSTTTTGIDLANVTALNIEDVRLGGDISILRKKVELNTIFYAYYLSNYKKNELAKYAQGITIVHLYFSHLKNIKVDFPQVNEQNKIAEFLLKVERKKFKIDDFISDLGMFKKAMLQKIFV